MRENYRKCVILHCGIDKQRLEITQGKHNLYLRCPFYKQEKRPQNILSCQNRISKSDANRVYDYIEGLDIDGKLKVGKAFRLVNIDAKVIEINDFYIVVEVINRHKVKSEKFI